MPQRILLKIRRFLSRTDGPTAVEYAVILALIVGMTVVSIGYFGDEVKALSDLIKVTLHDALVESE